MYYIYILQLVYAYKIKNDMVIHCSLKKPFMSSETSGLENSSHQTCVGVFF